MAWLQTVVLIQLLIGTCHATARQWPGLSSAKDDRRQFKDERGSCEYTVRELFDEVHVLIRLEGFGSSEVTRSSATALESSIAHTVETKPVTVLVDMEKATTAAPSSIARTLSFVNTVRPRISNVYIIATGPLIGLVRMVLFLARSQRFRIFPSWFELEKAGAETSFFSAHESGPSEVTRTR